ncbi:MAG TPA: adenylate/guanylate cyclase domain-containing protein [Spirochaetia bacterium]|nr:adenylate/guanylate cyclase domain-containing protein [Spirochaetia bacterium]
MRIEHSINLVRVGIVAAGVLLDLYTAVTQHLAQGQYELFAVGIIAFVAVYLAIVHIFSRGKVYHGWVKYLTITVDYALIFAYFAEMMRPQFAGRVNVEAIISVSVALFVVFVMLNALRLSRSAVIYGTLLGAGLTIFLTLAYSRQPILRIWLTPIVVTSGAVAYWISRNIRSIVRALWRREKLARFLPKELVEIVESSDVDLSLGGKATTATVLFADIRSFTQFSEKRDPAEVVEVLNRYFSVMTAVIAKQGGMIDKFIGDAIMAVFGAPLPREGDAMRAVAAAGEMLSQLELLNREWASDGRPPLAIGIALHTGTVIAGNIGSPDRMDYTVIGDTVNLASRLEGLNKKYHTGLLISGDTRDAAGSSADMRFLGESEVRGREQPVRLYTI